MPVVSNSFSCMHLSTSYRTHLFVHVPTLLPLPSIDYFYFSLHFSIKDQFIPYRLNPYLCLSTHQDHSTWCSQRIRHLSPEYAGHTPILRYSVTYLHINQLVEFPADSAPSIRIGRPSHTLARMYQLSYSFRYFRPYSPPPLQPQVH